MGIQLDWQVEVQQTRQRDQEDPESRQRRRRARWRLLMLAALVALVVCAVVVGIAWRLDQVAQREQDDLRAAVEAELNAIRIGSLDAYMNMQRSASEPWLENQRIVFQEYQNLKQGGRLSGETKVVAQIIDESRARVIVEETIDGIAYRQAWFYWRYESANSDDQQIGWRHVPPDVTFWGEEKTIERPHLSLTYCELDEAFALALADRVDGWWALGCTLLACNPPPPKLELIIDPQAGIPLAWEPDDGWRLRLISPLLNGRVSAVTPLSPALDAHYAGILAGRLLTYVSGAKLQFTTQENLIAFDSTWLKYQLRDWLAGEFTGQPLSPFVSSLVTAFGSEVPSRLAATLTDGGQINLLAPALDPAKTNLTEFDAATLGQIDWRGFFEWRLSLERQRLLSADLDNFFALYETGNFNEAANLRAYDPAYRSSPPESVTAVAFSYRADGTLVALVDVTGADGAAAQISFAWYADTFLRVN